MNKMRLKKSKKGQIAIFVIIAIVLVSVLVILFLPRIQEAISPASPSIQIEDCLSENVEGLLPEIMAKGGSLNPTSYIMYADEEIEYLCYNSEWYQQCVMQKPLLLQSIENELKVNSENKIRTCLEDAKANLKRKGYTINEEGTGDIEIDIRPNHVLVTSGLDMQVSKGEDVKNLKLSDSSEFDSNAYDMIMIATSILNYEARYGDSYPENYMAIYPNIKVEQLKQSEGSTIYIITDRNTEEVFKFASRSIAWPPGVYYG